jgi:tetratricopeptide (TPR) repeat protein
VTCAALPDPVDTLFEKSLRITVISLLAFAIVFGAFTMRDALDQRRQRQLIAWADWNLSARRYDDAAALYARAVQHNPADVDLLDKWGDALYQTGAARPEALRDARGAWELALTRRPNHLPTLKRLLALDAERADQSPSREAFEELEGAAKQVARLDPHDVRARTLQRIAPIHILLLNEKPNDAISAVDALMPELPNLARADQVTLLRLGGEAYSNTTPAPQVGKARDAYVALIDRAPDDMPALNNLAYLLLEQTTPPDPQQALKYSERAYRVMERAGTFDPSVADTHGWALANAGHVREAIDLLAKVVEQLPAPETEGHLGEACLMARKPEEAALHLGIALDLLRQAEQNGRPPDPALRARCAAAHRRALEMTTTSEPSPSSPTTAPTTAP